MILGYLGLRAGSYLPSTSPDLPAVNKSPVSELRAEVTRKADEGTGSSANYS